MVDQATWRWNVRKCWQVIPVSSFLILHKHHLSDPLRCIGWASVEANSRYHSTKRFWGFWYVCNGNVVQESCLSGCVVGWWSWFHDHLSPWFFTPGKHQPSRKIRTSLWEMHLFSDSHTSSYVMHGISCLVGVPPEPSDAIAASKSLVCEYHV